MSELKEVIKITEEELTTKCVELNEKYVALMKEIDVFEHSPGCSAYATFTESGTIIHFVNKNDNDEPEPILDTFRLRLPPTIYLSFHNKKNGITVVKEE